MLVRNATWVFGEKVLRSLVGLIVGLGVIRYLGPEGYGKLGFVMAAVMLGAPFARLGLDQIVLREYARNDLDPFALFRKLFKLRALSSAVSACFFSLALLLSRPDLSRAAILIGSMLVAIQALDLSAAWCQAHGHQKQLAVAAMIVTLVAALLRLALIHYRVPMEAFLLMLAVEQFLIAIANFCIFRNYAGREIVRSLNSLSSPIQVNEIVHSVLTALVVILYFRMEALILPFFIGNSQSGVYLAAVQILDGFGVLPAILGSVVGPILIRRYASGQKQFFDLFEHTLRVVTAFGLLAVGCLLLLSGIGLEKIIGAKFAGANGTVAILAIGLPIFFQGSIVDTYIVAARRVDFLFKKSVLALVIKAPLVMISALYLDIRWVASCHIISAFIATIAATYLVSPQAARYQMKAFDLSKLATSLKVVLKQSY